MTDEPKARSEIDLDLVSPGQALAFAAQAFSERKALRAELAAAREEIERLKEKERMVDASISVLSMSNTRDTLKGNKLPRENPYWTPAQDDVEKAVVREIDHREARERAEAALNAALIDQVRANTRAERAEARVKEIAPLLMEAYEDVHSWGNYASDYFQKKHNLTGCAEKYRVAALAARQKEDSRG